MLMLPTSSLSMLMAWLVALCCLSLGVPPAAQAQGRASHIERSTNYRLSGTVIATVRGLTWEQCEARCLGEQRCIAIEHFRGGFVLNRATQCKLFSTAGDRRANRYADIGFKRPGVGAPRKESAAEIARKKAEDEKRQAAEAAVQSKAAAESSKAAEAAQRDIADKARATEAARRRTTAREASPPSPPPSGPGIAPALPPSSGGSAPPSDDRERASRQNRNVATAPATETARPAPPAASPPAVAPPAAAPPAPATAPPPSAASRTRSLPRPSATAAAAPTDWDVVPVFYGTDRNRRDQAKRIAYGSDRARRLELGRAMITVPKAHQIPNVERPWVIKIPYIDVTLYSEAEDPKRHFTIQELKALSKEEVLRLVHERLAVSGAYKDQALVLVHGYNNGFDEALYRTAQIAYDLKFDGAPFLYSWPSGGGITSYPYDRDSAQQAEQYLSQFLQMVLNETGAKAVNLIAHSMGNQPLLQVLRDLKHSSPAISSRLNQVILAAPDVDRDTFVFLAGQIKGMSKGITMYASSNDVALGVSRRFAGGVPRAGDVPGDIGPVVVGGIDTIDISTLSTDYLSINHSTYAEKTALLQDIELVLRTGERPPERRIPILQRIKGEQGEYWRYPK